MRWTEALKQWNAHHKTVNPKHVWMVPRKGTPEHAQVMLFVKGGKAEDIEVKGTGKAISVKGKDVMALPEPERKKVYASLKEKSKAAPPKIAPAPAAAPAPAPAPAAASAELIKRLEAARDKAFDMFEKGSEGVSYILEESGADAIKKEAPWKPTMTPAESADYLFRDNWVYDNIKQPLIKMGEEREAKSASDMASKLGAVPKTRDKAWIIKDRRDFKKVFMAAGMSKEVAEKGVARLQYDAENGIAVWRPKKNVQIEILKSDFEKRMDEHDRAISKGIKEMLDSDPAFKKKVLDAMSPQYAKAKMGGLK